MEENIIYQSEKTIVSGIVKKYVTKKYLKPINSIYKEAESTQFANKINDLVVKYVDVIKDINNNPIVILERLYPVKSTFFTKSELLSFIIDFEKNLNELHSSGFVYLDLNRTFISTSNSDNTLHSNVMLTVNGFRLIDCELAVLKKDVIESDFETLVKNEKEFLQEMKNYALNRINNNQEIDFKRFGLEKRLINEMNYSLDLVKLKNDSIEIHMRPKHFNNDKLEKALQLVDMEWKIFVPKNQPNYTNTSNILSHDYWSLYFNDDLTSIIFTYSNCSAGPSGIHNVGTKVLLIDLKYFKIFDTPFPFNSMIEHLLETTSPNSYYIT